MGTSKSYRIITGITLKQIKISTDPDPPNVCNLAPTVIAERTAISVGVGYGCQPLAISIHKSAETAPKHKDVSTTV